MLPKRRKRKRTKPLPDRVRSAGHLAHIRRLECAIAGRHVCEGKIEAAHIRSGTDGGLSVKPGDCWAIPLCSAAHREQHQIGEDTFDCRYGIERATIAGKLWARSPHRPLWERWIRKQREMAG